MKITSPTFNDGGEIPRKYTCDGTNISPPLKFENVPKNTVSMALICDDPDAPSKVWTHWIIFNLPSDIEILEEAVETKETLANGIIQGLNDSGNRGYRGPCPPGGVHRYFFKLYALNKKIDPKKGYSKKMLLDDMDGHILDSAELMGIYSR